MERLAFQANLLCPFNLIKSNLKLFEAAFHEHKELKVKDLGPKNEQVLGQVASVIGKTRFNHYCLANALAKSGVKAKTFSDGTLDAFEQMFKTINERFDT